MNSVPKFQQVLWWPDSSIHSCHCPSDSMNVEKNTVFIITYQMRDLEGKGVYRFVISIFIGSMTYKYWIPVMTIFGDLM